MKASQNLDFLLNILPTTFDILTRQKSSGPPCEVHKALGAWDNTYLQAILSHPANIIYKYGEEIYCEELENNLNLKRKTLLKEGQP